MEEATVALVEAQRSAFIKNKEYSLPDFRQDDDGAVCTIGGEDIPLMDMAFDLQIVQPGSVMKDKSLSKVKGKILVVLDKDNKTEEATDKMRLMPITIVTYGQRYFGEYADSSDNKPVCRSSDGLKPSPRIAIPMNPECAKAVFSNGTYRREMVCPYGKWVDGKKPACGSTVTLAFFDLDRKIPVRIQLHGAGMGAWTSLQQAYKQKKNVARLKKMSMNDYIIELTLEDNGTYFTPVFRIVEPDDDIKPREYLPVCKYYMENLFTRVVADDDDTGGGSEAAPQKNVTEVAAVEVTAEEKEAEAAAEDFSI